MSDARGVRAHGLIAGYGGFRRRKVLDGVDLEALPGRVTALVGPNGVGKTTLFRVLAGFLKPWSGEVQVDGLTPRANRRNHGVAYLPESVSLPPGFTLEAFLREGARLARLSGSVAATAVRDAMEASGLADSAGRALTTFSKGMGRRAALAYALLGHPTVLLLDEPMSGLDPRSRAALRETVAKLRVREATIIVASHELLDLQRSADVAFVLDRGRVRRRIEAEELSGADLERIVLESEPSS